MLGSLQCLPISAGLLVGTSFRKKKPKACAPGFVHAFVTDDWSRFQTLMSLVRIDPINLLAQAVAGDCLAVSLDIRLLQVGKKASALTDHLQQAAAGMVILAVAAEVIGEFQDSLGQNSDLDFRRTGIGIMKASGLDDVILLCCLHRHSAGSP